MTEVPKITAEEAAVLRTRLYHPSLLARAHARIALHGWDDENAAVGEAALARYEAEREREIRRKAIEESPLLLAASKLADVDGRKAILQDTDFDALDDEWHDAIREVCRCAREVQP